MSMTNSNKSLDSLRELSSHGAELTESCQVNQTCIPWQWTLSLTNCTELKVGEILFWLSIYISDYLWLSDSGELVLILAVFLSLSRQVEVEAPELASHLAVNVEPPVAGEILLLEQSACTQQTSLQTSDWPSVTHRWDRGSWAWSAPEFPGPDTRGRPGTESEGPHSNPPPPGLGSWTGSEEPGPAQGSLVQQPPAPRAPRAPRAPLSSPPPAGPTQLQHGAESSSEALTDTEYDWQDWPATILIIRSGYPNTNWSVRPNCNLL